MSGTVTGPSRRWAAGRHAVLALAIFAAAGVAAAEEGGPTAGDDGGLGGPVPAINVPLAAAPVAEVELESADGVDLRFFWRRPQADGPVPVILFLHGGGKQVAPQRLEQALVRGAVQTRFLAAGFATVECTRRPFWKERADDGPAGFDAAVVDTVRIIEKVRRLPGTDGRLVLYGGSGGGILALVAASRTAVAGVIAGEPATVVPLAPGAGAGGKAGRGYRDLMADPQAAYVGERREAMRAWMAKIGCPMLLLQGKAEGLHKINTEILVPELRSLDKDVTVAEFPHVTHGFYWGNARTGATPELIDRVVRESTEFIHRLPEATAGDGGATAGR